MRKTEMPLLVADVGGTKTVIALASLGESNTLELTSVQTFPSQKSTSLDALLERYLATVPTRPTRAAIAVAGPVFDGQVRITNLSWTVDASALRETYGFQRVVLLNDLEAMGWSIPHVGSDDIEVLQDEQEQRDGTIALLAAGTGLGAAFLTWNGAAYDVHATEAGHADFAPTNDEQVRLLAYLREIYGRVGVERVCSGLGIANIYQFLLEDSSRPDTPSIQERLAAAEDVTPVIVAAANAKESAICEHTVRLFAESLASEAGSFALRVKATGGIYFGGGLLQHVLPFLRKDAFLDQFSSKGRFSAFLRGLPVTVLRDPWAAVHGAAWAGLGRMSNQTEPEGRHLIT